MTKSEARDHYDQQNRLMALGISREDTETLRRISMTLRRWFELECGAGDGQTSISIERDGDDGEGKPFRRIQYPTTHGYVDQRYPIADCETGARKRLKTIMDRYPALTAYVQSDPRGCSLYILRPEDVPLVASINSYYTRGVAIA